MLSLVVIMNGVETLMLIDVTLMNKLERFELWHVCKMLKLSCTVHINKEDGDEERVTTQHKNKKGRKPRTNKPKREV